MEMAGVGALLHEQLDLLVGDRRLAAVPHRKEPQHEFGHRRQEPYGRRGDPRQQGHAAADAGSDGLRPARRALRHEFAEYQGQEGDDHAADGRQGVGIGGYGRYARKDNDQVVGNLHAAIGPGDDVGEGEADLDGREEPAGMLGEAEGRGGALVALVRHLLQARLACGDDRHLAHGEQALNQDQQQDDQYLERHISAFVPPRALSRRRPAIPAPPGERIDLYIPRYLPANCKPS